jgi:hypothetical protein
MLWGETKLSSGEDSDSDDDDGDEDEYLDYASDDSYNDNYEIKYTLTYMERYWGDADPVAANVLAAPVIEESLAETAKELVGGKGWAVRDCLEDEDGTLALTWGPFSWILDFS